MGVDAIPHQALSRQDSIPKGGAVDSRFCCNICLDPVVDPVTTRCGHLYCWPCLYRWLEPGMQPDERVSLGLLQRPSTIDSNRRVCPVCKTPCSVPTLVPIYVRESADTDSGTKSSSGKQRVESSKVEGPDDKGADTSDHDSVAGASEGEIRREQSSETMGTEGMMEMEGLENITGLRQRLRFRSRDSENSTDTVPTSLATNSPRHNNPSSPSSTPPTPQRYRNNIWGAPLSPAGHHGSLTHGLLLSFQQATSATSGVPPLHHRGNVAASEMDTLPSGTEYLSRLLIMLTSFVILCLLLL